MVNMAIRAKVGEGIERTVVGFIPRSEIRATVGKEARRAGMLGYRIPDYVLETRLKELHTLRTERVISRGEFNEMYFEIIDETVNAPQNCEYVRDFQALMERHHRYPERLSIEKQLKEIGTLREKYEH